VVAEETLVLQGDVDALLGPEVDPRTRGTFLQVEHVLLQRGCGSAERLEVSPLLCVRDGTGGVGTIKGHE